MSNLGGTTQSENTDADTIATGTVTSVNAGTNVTVTGTATDPIINAVAGGIPAARMSRTTNLTMDGNQIITFTTEDYDDNDLVTISGTTDRFTIPTGVTRVNVYFDAVFFNMGAGRYNMIVDHLDSGDSVLYTQVLNESVVDTLPAGQGVILGLSVVATDYIQFRITADDTSYTLTVANATIQDVSP